MRVMIVEDEADLAQILAVMFRYHDVETVTWGADYRLLLGPDHWRGIDGAVVDRMLGHDQPAGEEILQWLAEHRPDIRRILLTGFDGGVSDGLAHRSFIKPVPFELLLASLGVGADG